MASPRKPTAGFWITVALVVALVGYPLSFGLFIWLYNRGFLPDQIVAVGVYFHYPFFWISISGPEPLRSAINWYGNLWVPRP